MARVLIVDDDGDVRTILRVLLEGAGHTVVEAGDGVAALQAIRDAGVDLVLSDLFMPTMDGLELIRALRRERPDLKVIAISGGAFKGSMDLLSVARVLGAAEVVSKPFTPDAIRAAVERVLGPPPDR